MTEQPDLFEDSEREADDNAEDFTMYLIMRDYAWE